MSKMVQLKIKKTEIRTVLLEEFGIEETTLKCLKVWCAYAPQIRLQSFVEVKKVMYRVLEINHKIDGAEFITILFCRPLLSYERKPNVRMVRK